MIDMFHQFAPKTLRPHQVEAIDMIRQSFGKGTKRVVCQMPTGAGKCLGFGTPVVMADGSIKPVEAVEVGDRLASPTGEPVSVLSLARGRERMFRVTPVKGDTWTCNASHLLSVKVTGAGSNTYFADGQVARGEKGQVITIRADDLHKSSVTARHISKQWRPTAVHFEGGEALAMPAYALGVWLGDGTSMRPDVSKPHGAVSDAWSEYSESVGCSIRVSYGSTGCPTYHASTARGRANPILDLLRDLDVLGNKHIPQRYKTASVSDRLSLLAGIFDTDGHGNHGGVDFISKDMVLADDVAFMCRSVGLAAYVKECTKGIAKTGFSGTYWRVSVSGDCSRIPCRRLKISPRKQIKDHLVTGFTLTDIGEGDYYGFEVTGDRLFLLGDFTVTHNTLTAAKIIERALAKRSRVIFTAPAISLINQTVDAFEAEGLQGIGVMQANHPRTDKGARIQVASVQTLARREIPEASLIIVDECHIRSKAVEKLMDERPDVFFIGLSATPWAKGMGLRWQDLVIPVTIGGLIDVGLLSKFSAFAPDVPDLSNVKTLAGDYAEDGLAKIMGSAKLIGSVVETWLEKGENRPTLAFGVNCAHAEQLHHEFIRAGVSSAYVDARVDIVEREFVNAQFRNGDVRVICSVRTMTTGVDLPVSCIIDAAPTKSRILHCQKIGRGLRVNPGSEGCLILDHAGNSIRLGLVTDIHQERLDMTEPGEKQPVEQTEKLPKPCSKCGVLHVGKTCPACGHEREAFSGVEAADGQLVEITGKKKTATALDKQEFWSMALWLDAERNRGGKLAKGLYKGRFGVWPVGLNHKIEMPSQAFMNYEKSQRIAYAKRMEAKRGVA